MDMKLRQFYFAILACVAIALLGICNANHVCDRPCEDGAPVKVCRYQWSLEYYLTLSRACFDCPFNMTHCDKPDCVTADGVERGIATVNRKLPGPGIHVCEGDEIIVDIKNRLGTEGTTIHWHGQHMEETPYMDGVPWVTQCPIPPHSSFQYRFPARTPGTHFYHSHSGFQRADGIFGPMVVRQTPSRDPHFDLYDLDLTEHAIIVVDWIREMGLSKFVAFHHDDGDNRPTSLLVNGKGRFRLPRRRTEVPPELMPLARFVVKKGFRYRFRVISSGVLNCPVQISIDRHALLVIATDGKPIVPVQVRSLVISPGERYDFVLEANSKVDNYWMRFHGLIECAEDGIFEGAVLQYQGASDTADPREVLTYNNTNRSGKILNPANVAPGRQEEITVAELSALDDSDVLWKEEPDHQFFLAYDFNLVNNDRFFHPKHYSALAMNTTHRRFLPQINDISMTMSPIPLLPQRHQITPNMLCNESTVSNCNRQFCECPFTLNVELDSVVELVIIDKGLNFNATHPLHLHGSSFRVVAMERLGTRTTVEEVKARDRQGLIRRKLRGAVCKDTVAVPDGGYVIVRFLARNPGYWLFHCHLEFHLEVGMGLVFKVGEHADMLPVPRNFPQCGDWPPPSVNDVRESDIRDSTRRGPNARDEVRKGPSVRDEVRKVPNVRQEVRKVPNVREEVRKVPNVRDDVRNGAYQVRDEIDHGNGFVNIEQHWDHGIPETFTWRDGSQGPHPDWHYGFNYRSL